MKAPQQHRPQPLLRCNATAAAALGAGGANAGEQSVRQDQRFIIDHQPNRTQWMIGLHDILEPLHREQLRHEHIASARRMDASSPHKSSEDAVLQQPAMRQWKECIHCAE
jgi:hypothetical protein